MNKLKTYGVSLFAAVVLLASGTALSLTVPHTSLYLSTRANALIAEGDRVASANTVLALGNYRLASILDNSSPAPEKSADIYIQLDRPQDAVSSLLSSRNPNYLRIAQIQFDSSQFERSLSSLDQIVNQDQYAATLRIKNLLELDLVPKAKAIAAEAYSKYNDQANGLLQGLAFAIAADTDNTRATISSLGTTEASQTLQRASSSNISLAKVLYNLGLLRSSERLLKTQPDTSEAYLLLAKIKLASKQPSSSDLNEAKAAVETAKIIDPGNLLVHELAKDIYQRAGDSALADRESSLINQLRQPKSSN